MPEQQFCLHSCISHFTCPSLFSARCLPEAPLHAFVASLKPLANVFINACSSVCKEDICQAQHFQAAEHSHVKDLICSLQQEVAELQAGNAKLQSHCSEKADKEHMQNVSHNMLLGHADLQVIMDRHASAISQLCAQYIYHTAMKPWKGYIFSVLKANSEHLLCRYPASSTDTQQGMLQKEKLLCRSWSICATPKPLLWSCKV